MDGTTADISCMMIEALMYGMMPNEKTAPLRSAPPVNMLYIATTPPADLSAMEW